MWGGGSSGPPAEVQTPWGGSAPGLQTPGPGPAPVLQLRRPKGPAGPPETPVWGPGP